MTELPSHGWFRCAVVAGASFVVLCLVAVRVGAEEKADISVTHEGVRVLVSEDGPLSAACRFEIQHHGGGAIHHFTLHDPSRLVVDLKGVRVARGKVYEASQARCVSAVRFGIQPQGTRVVFDLRGVPPESYDVAGPETDKSGITRLSARFRGASVGAQVELETRRAGEAPTPLPTPTATVTVLPTLAPTVLPTVTPILTPTLTPTFTPTATPTSTPTRTPSSTPTGTPVPTATVEPTTPAGLAPMVGGESPSSEGIPPKSEQGVVGAVILPPGAVDEAKLKFRVDKILVEFGGKDRPVRNIGVTNVSGDTLQMTTRVVRLMNPGAPNETEEETADLLVSPRFLTLQPGAERQVRVVAVVPAPEGERVYRIHLVPQRGEFEPRATVAVGAHRGSVDVVTALAVLVLQAGDDAQAKLTSRQEGTILVVGNEGTRSVLLSEVRRCSDADRSSCREIPGRRLFPGNEWRVEVAPEGALTMLAREGDHFETVSLKGASR